MSKRNLKLATLSIVAAAVPLKKLSAQGPVLIEEKRKSTVLDNIRGTFSVNTQGPSIWTSNEIRRDCKSYVFEGLLNLRITDADRVSIGFGLNGGWSEGMNTVEAFDNSKVLQRNRYSENNHFLGVSAMTEIEIVPEALTFFLSSQGGHMRKKAIQEPLPTVSNANPGDRIVNERGHLYTKFGAGVALPIPVTSRIGVRVHADTGFMFTGNYDANWYTGLGIGIFYIKNQRSH